MRSLLQACPTLQLTQEAEVEQLLMKLMTASLTIGVQ